MLAGRCIRASITKVKSPIRSSCLRYNATNVHNDPTKPEFIKTRKNFDLKSFGIGFTMGASGGMVGIGGGVIAVPLLTGVLKFTQHQAHGTSLAAVSSTAFVGASTYYLYGDGAVDIFAASIIATSASIASTLGAKYCAKASGRTLKLLIAGFTFSAAILAGWKEYKSYEGMEKDIVENVNIPELVTEESNEIVAEPKRHDISLDKLIEEFKHRATIQEVTLFTVIGSVTGLVSSILGVGGGIVLLPLLTMGTDMSHSVVIGTALSCFLPITVTGTIAHSLIGNVVWRSVPGLFIGSSIGAYLGSRLSIWMSESQQRATLIVLMLSVGVRSLLK